ncbi:MAG TPA: 6-phosphogluconolactonase [Solirubrobacteraceae bacterium]|nr:6-phosphogluconolactonase [Solirubrobacteraceae bacterium]
MQCGSDAIKTTRGASIRELADAQALGRTCAAIIAERLRALLARRQLVHLALCGGRSPVLAYELLGASDLPWERVQLWFVDERCVGPDDPDSNALLVRKTLLAGAHGCNARLRRIEGERGPQEAAKSYEALLHAHLEQRQDGLPQLDLALLGIGEDGHIASLFPDHAALEQQSGRLCLPVLDSPKPPPERVTLSLAMLRGARGCLLLASGAAKARALARALGAPSGQAPVSMLDHDRLCVLADRPAAAELAEAVRRA